MAILKSAPDIPLQSHSEYLPGLLLQDPLFLPFLPCKRAVVFSERVCDEGFHCLSGTLFRDDNSCNLVQNIFQGRHGCLNYFKGGMHLTAPNTICSISCIWRNTRERCGSLRPAFPPRVRAANFYFNCGGQTVLSVHDVERTVVGLQRADG